MSELKQCPFCGGTAIEIRSNGIGDYFCICYSNDEDALCCGAKTSDVCCESKQGAIDRWNTRHDERENQQLKAKLDEWSNKEILGETERCKFNATLTENAALKAELQVCAEALKRVQKQSNNYPKPFDFAVNKALSQPITQSISTKDKQ